MTGKVVELHVNRGFGWVQSGAREVYFHAADSRRSITLLRVGTLVEFTVDESGPRGPRCVDVRPLGT